ncbi:MAG: hypothetical protein JWN92_1421 [Candidatus Acidoferrum typicum]|nr:hypothetical protein [Candidatus Acidoferrum typicum]
MVVGRFVDALKLPAQKAGGRYKGTPDSGDTVVEDSPSRVFRDGEGMIRFKLSCCQIQIKNPQTYVFSCLRKRCRALNMAPSAGCTGANPANPIPAFISS